MEQKYKTTNDSENKTSSNQDNLDGKKETLDGARSSTETAMKDKSIDQGYLKSMSWLFGFLVLLSSIANYKQDLKCGKKGYWVYSRIIFDFTASGAIIGFSIEKTLIGIVIGLTLGNVLTLYYLIKVRCVGR